MCKVAAAIPAFDTAMDRLIRAALASLVVVVALASLAVVTALAIDVTHSPRPQTAIASTHMSAPRAADRVVARRSASGSRILPQNATASAAPGGAPAAAALAVSDPQQRYEQIARAAAAKYDIDPNVFVRQITQESHWDPAAISRAGALGIAQFMPSTAAWLGVDPLDPVAALDAAAKLDRDNLDAFDGDYAEMLAAYNAGRGSVFRYGGVPPFPETQNYVNLILGTDSL
jgi:soluble lytic murein transglycosylase-like protein